MKIAVTPDVIESIKKDLRQALREVKSSHRIEAVARGLGWTTNAAMRVTLASGTAERVVKADSFTRYLVDHGFAADAYHLVRAALRVQVRVIMAEHKELTHHGFGVY